MRFHLLLALGLLLGLAATAHARPLTIKDLTFPRPPVPDFGEDEMLPHAWGSVGDVKVVFGKDGKVADCVCYFGSAGMSMYVQHFIEDSWESPELAGETVYAYILIGMKGPVHVSLLPDLPYPAFAGPFTSGKVEIAVAFDHAGKIKSCKVTSCTYTPKFAEYVRQFVMDNWKSPHMADQAFNYPITYKLIR